MERRIWRLCCSWLLVVFLGGSHAGAEDSFLALDDVEPGMRGEWRTVTEGSEPRTFRLEIIGRVPNFLGPDKDAVLARALDPEHILSGPVAGMSGSPVYVEGRLLGAYAFGYSWPKEQAIIGITPIEHMLGLLETDAEGDAEAMEGSGLPAGEFLRPLPTPLLAGGIGTEALSWLEEAYGRMGVRPVAGGGGAVDRGTELPLEAGSAMAAILMQGDFTMAATGTVTYRDGDQLVGFGHPFLQWGRMEMPFGGAEILTIIRNLQISFKFSNPGPAVGTLFADRTTGVAGEIGPIPAMSELSLILRPEGGEQRRYEAELFRHAEMTPLLVATALAEGLSQATAAERESLLELRARVEVAGEAEAQVELADSGPGAAERLSLAVLDRMVPVFNNERSGPQLLDRVEMEVGQRIGWRETQVEAVHLDRERYRPGDWIRARVQGRDRSGERRHWDLQARLPELLPRGSRVRVVVADAARRDELRGGIPAAGLGSAELLAMWAERSPATVLSLWLVRDGNGMVVDGQELSGLPGSVRRRLGRGEAGAPVQILSSDEVRAETVFRGHWEEDILVERP